MSTNQLFFAIAALIVGLAGFMKWYIDAKVGGAEGTLNTKIDGLYKYIDAKIDPLVASYNKLLEFMADHESRISWVEERTKHL